ncbi:MAG TPA: lactate utilization protein [Bryobacteraceae bacterium]|jgi:L-lactate dehydrogenase complex protein LldG
MQRDTILRDVRAALGRRLGQAPPPPPPVRLVIPDFPVSQRIDSMLERVAALAGKTFHAKSKTEAHEYVASVLQGKTAVASNAPFLRECGINDLPGVRSGIGDREELRGLCATSNYGISSADYALSDTGSLVMIASPEEARLVSLLPPAHIAVVPASKLLTGLDELYSLLPKPAEQTSSMVFITGPSRTADIEQILVRGVHGPGEIHVVVVEGA